MNIIIVLLTHARRYKSTVPDPLFSTRGVATPDYYPTGSDKRELGGDTLLAEVLFTGEWYYPYLLECAEDLGVGSR